MHGNEMAMATPCTCLILTITKSLVENHVQEQHFLLDCSSNLTVQDFVILQSKQIRLRLCSKLNIRNVISISKIVYQKSLVLNLLTNAGLKIYKHLHKLYVHTERDLQG